MNYSKKSNEDFMMAFLRTKKGILLIAFACILIGSVYYIKHHKQAPEKAQDAIVVEMKKVEQGSIPIAAETVGTLVANKHVQLTSESAGQVKKIFVHDGQALAEGQIILQLDDTIYRAKADSAKANLVFSEASYNRMVALSKKGAVSLQVLDQALANLKEKRAIEKENRTLAEKMLIKAPFSGVLGKIKVTEGEHISVGQALVSLTDTKNLRVEFNISDKYLAKLKISQQVTLKTSAYPKQEFYGKVSFIAPTINSEDHTISIAADVPNQEGALTAGLFVNVTHLLGQANQVLLIPSVSILATIDGQQVYKVMDGKAVPVPVVVGQRTLDQVEIMEGLKLNDTVVVAGQHKLREGVAVVNKA
jgi:membrane fusion protein (multidrug efflux system)